MFDFALLVRNWDIPNYMIMYIAGGVLLNATMYMGEGRGYEVAAMGKRLN